MEAVRDRVAENDARLIFVPLEKATVPPPGLIEHIANSWWVVHPEKGVVFWDKKYMSPQCNTNELLTKRFAAMYPWAEVRFIPSVFRRINPQDYCN